MGRDFRWYWTAPRFQESLQKRVAGDRIEVGGGSIEVPGAPLVEAGCVAETHWRRGQLVVATTVDALIAAGRGEELRRCAEEGAKGAWLRLAGVADPATVYLLVLAFGDSQHVRSKLQASEDAQTAKAWKHLIGDAAEADRCLRAVEARAASASDFIACGEAWMSVSGDAAALRRCLGAAESRAGNLDEMLAVAVAWARLGDDTIGAQRGLERARAKGDDTTTLIACARAWRSLGDDAVARQTLADAETRAAGGADQAACASAQLEIFGDEEAFRRILEQTAQSGGWRWAAGAWHAAGDETTARATLEEADSRADSETLVGCADAWKNVLGDAERGRRCLSNAESRATGTRAWAACAAAWKRIYSDDNEMRRCLGEMEKHARDTVEWSQCAAYSADAGDGEGARRCLGRGQEVAQSSSDFVALANVWHKLEPRGAEVTRSVEEADTRAADVGAQVAAAIAFQEFLGDGNRARAALGRAEAGAVEKGGWSAIAHAWARVLGDVAAARRCLGEAERNASEAAHWTQLGSAFDRILGDEAESRRCRVVAMELQAGDDIGECARGWRRILDDDEARRRLQAREAGATGVDAWQRLSAAWRDVFGDEAAVQRCGEWVERWRRVQTAMDAGDWTAYARTWREILPEESDARGRLKSVEERAVSLSDWTAFARAWKRVFEDDAEARRCMESAEAKARFKSDWKLCGEAWRDLGQYGDAQRCSDHR